MTGSYERGEKKDEPTQASMQADKTFAGAERDLTEGQESAVLGQRAEGRVPRRGRGSSRRLAVKRNVRGEPRPAGPGLGTDMPQENAGPSQIANTSADQPGPEGSGQREDTPRRVEESKNTVVSTGSVSQAATHQSSEVHGLTQEIGDHDTEGDPDIGRTYKSGQRKKLEKRQSASAAPEEVVILSVQGEGDDVDRGILSRGEVVRVDAEASDVKEPGDKAQFRREQSKSTKSRTDEIVDIMHYLLGGERWRPGMRLPTGPEIQERYNISAKTVTRLHQRLRDAGLIESGSADGVFVAGATPGQRRMAEALEIARLTGIEVVKRPTPDEIAESYMQSIQDGNLLSGTRIASITELQDQYAITRRAAQRVHRRLSDEGLTVHRQNGTFVGHEPVRPATELQIQNRAALGIDDLGVSADLPLLIADKIYEEIISGERSPGSQIPSIKNLELTYGINQTEAINVQALLKQTGLVVRENKFLVVRQATEEALPTEMSADRTVTDQPKRPTIPQRIAEYYIGQIDRGKLPPGSRLPSVAQLRAQHHISQTIATRIHKILAQQNRTVSNWSGTYVGRFPAELPKPTRRKPHREVLADRIEAVKLPPDTELFTEELAIVHGVSHNSMVQIFNVLKSRGYIRREHKRWFVT